MYARNERIVPVYVEDEMRDSYISYAMSVIVGRALPDARDGLKPVHRRILYAMQELNLKHNQPYKKSARIVGTVLGQYHPHGDIAVYDALVRMAQDFSLRYPLVDGQGNFGCFTKDTKIRLTDGRVLNFEELIKETERGKKNYTFTFNPEGQKIEIAEIKNPRLTRKNAEITKVVLDDGQEIKCTPDHLFMLRDGTYRKAKDLKSQDSLMPLYTKLYDGKNDINLKGYETIHQPLQNSWEFIHHLADEWNLKNNVYKKSVGKIRHHRDFNKLNNNPDNVQRIQWNQHWRLHKEFTSYKHKNDLEYVKKLAEGRKKFWADSKNRQEASLRWTALNQKKWQDPIYRERMSGIIRQSWKRPEYRRRIIEASSRHLKSLWQKKEFQELLSRLKSAELKKKWQNQDYRDFIAEVTQKTSLRIWANPKHREHISKLNKERWDNPEYRQRMSKQSKELWGNPEFRSKYSSDHFKNMAKKLWDNPAMKEFHREKAKKQWENQEFRTKFICGVTKSNQRRLRDNPYLMQELTQKARVALKERWQEPLYKERVIKSKILGFVSNILRIEKAFIPELYENKRTTGLPKIETVLEYFSDFEDLVSQAKQRYNHKVIAIELLDKREDVYDLTIEPWHNFALASGVFVHNSVDGDAPAAMRYTETRLAAITDSMLIDIDKETVDFMPNFDETLWEPTVLPACLPNLLVNGSSGIAVGMATNIPPHNLTEVVDAISLVIDNPDCSIEDLMKLIKGPDFPTGGIICGRDEIKEAYRTGRGLLKLRAKASVETLKSGKEQIVVTELPYQVNKSSLIESIANLVQDKRIEGISDLRDESDKEGIRIAVELKRDQEAELVLNQLFKHTQMETTFGVIMLALVEGRPRVLDLKQAISVYIDHRKEIITRRTRFELNKAQNRAHILEGLKKALAHLDEVIKTIKKSKTVPEAKESLIKGFDLSPEQAQAILEMQLQRLTHLEREKIDAEYLDLIKRIELYRSILASEKKVFGIIEEELLDLKKKFADERRTKIAGEAVELEVEDLIAEEDVVITISHSGYIKRIPVSSYRKQRRGGKGVTGMETREEDFVEHLFIASTHDYILIFTDKGKLYWLKVHEIPIGSRTAKGKAMVNLLQLSSEESISSLIPVRKFEEGKFLVMATRQGLIKKTSITAFSNPRKAGIIAITLEDEDELIEAELTDGKQELLLATKLGKAIRFRESQVRDMGRAAKGVKGITLAKSDRVIAMEAVRSKSTLLTVTSEGFGKRTPVEGYRIQSRGGKGIINIKVTKRNGEAVGAKVVSDTDELMVMTQCGMIVRCPIKDIRTTGRNSQGVKIIKLEPKDKVVSFARVVIEEE